MPFFEKIHLPNLRLGIQAAAITSDGIIGRDRGLRTGNRVDGLNCRDAGNFRLVLFFQNQQHIFINPLDIAWVIEII